MFMNDLKETLNEDFNESITENNAIGYRTTGKELLDMNFMVSSMRKMSDKQIIDKFVKAFYENKMYAIKWLYYVRDAREGVGERRLFRVCMEYLAKNHTDIAKAMIPLTAEYGRWDDLLSLLDTELADNVIELFGDQLTEDMKNLKSNKPISLLGKWMPSCNASSRKTRKLGAEIAEKLGISERKYRKMLSALRKYLDVVEVKMAAGQWDQIDYSKVSSRANLIYNNAFLRHDEERRRKYLESLQKGETKINVGVLFPHDIVHKYCNLNYWRINIKNYDTALEEMWKALPDYVNGAGNTICVADGSGSMYTRVGGTNVMAIEVANALAIYLSERCSGQFKDNYITFSMNPKLVSFSNAKSLKEKIEVALKHTECANTNIEAVFDLILKTAIRKNMTQDELPQNILILSDMEFDSCARTSSNRWNETPNQKLFKVFEERYAEHGYKLPRLVFWNICSRTGTIPVKENDLGVALVSGFSPAVVKMVLSNSTDPLECLLEQLNSERYQPVEDAIKELVA